MSRKLKQGNADEFMRGTNVTPVKVDELSGGNLMKIEQTTPSTIDEIWEATEPGIQRANFLEEAARELVTALHNQFAESVVITRVFVTVPFDTLPKTNKKFVENLVKSAGVSSALEGTVPVLSLPDSRRSLIRTG